MRYVGYDQMRHRRAEFTAPRRRPMGVLLPALLFFSVALLVLSRLDHGYIGSVRWKVAEVMSPVLRAAMVPLEPVRSVASRIGDAFTTVAEVERLRNEAQVLKGWEWRAKELERKLSELAATANTARETEVDFITVRVIANSSGAFVRSAMINAGGDQRLKPGYPVLSGDGLVGRIVDTGSNAARVLLLTDAQSRIPVHVGPQAVRAVLAGDNGPRPRLVFTAPDSVVKPGDEVSTSGIGGLFPRGLRIGTVMDGGERPTVKPHADLDVVEYLSVLLYETPELELLEADPPPRAALKEARP
jgi:rod shape-determining protein MreC